MEKPLIREIPKIHMTRDEIILRGHHILLASKLSTVHQLGLHINPFNDNIEEFFEVVWLVKHELAINLVLEGNSKRWREKEWKSLHGVSVPPTLEERWNQILVNRSCEHV